MEQQTKVIRGATLKGWQNDFVREFKSLRSDETLVVKKSRQVGCSFTVAQILFFVAFGHPQSESIYITTTNAAARKFFKDMAAAAKNSTLVTINESYLEMKFCNGSIIYFRSSESQLRGMSCRRGGIMVADECAFLNADIWTQILPFTQVSKANKIVCSTPWSKHSQFFTFYSQAMQGEKGYHLIDTANYDLSDFISEEQKRTYRQILSPQAYATEIDGNWLDASEGVFGDYASVMRQPQNDNVVYAGIDFSVGVGTDDTVVATFNEYREMVGLYIDNETADPVRRAEKIADYLNRFAGLRKAVAETNSMGSTFISIMQRKLINPSVIRPFTTTNASKKELIEGLIAAIGQKQITLLPDPKLDYEFGIFKLQELHNGNYTYQADTKVSNSHDDIVMATAFAVKAFQKETNYIFR